MKKIHKDYLELDLPEGWNYKEDNETTAIFSDVGDGALTLSFYSATDIQISLDEHISIMAKKYIDKNNVELEHALILDATQKDQYSICGTGVTSNDWFIKLWIVAKYPKIIVATYLSQDRTNEIKKVEKIIKSFRFLI